MDGQDIKLDVSADISLRKGVYSNFVSIASLPKEEVLDFFFIDGTGDDGVMTGAMAARIVMTREALRELSDALVRHLSTGDAIQAAGEEND